MKSTLGVLRYAIPPTALTVCASYAFYAYVYGVKLAWILLILF
jgi:hypothetical protein